MAFIRGLLWGALFMLMCGEASLEAKTFTGRITKLSDDGQSVTLYSTVQQAEETFSLRGRELRITINGRPGKIEQLQVGDRCTVFTSTAGVTQRLIVNQGDETAATPGTQPSKPAVTPPGNAPPAENLTPNMAGNPSRPTPSRPEPSRPSPFRRPGEKDREQPTAEGWPAFLGPDGQNRSADTGLLKEWPSNGPRLLWTARNLGEGYSSVCVVEGKVFTMGTRQGSEVVLALDLENGQELWSARNGSVFNENMGNGPRGTPTYDQGQLYCLGAAGDLSCVNAANGQVKWQQNILQRYGANNIVWGISESPLVDGDKVIVTPGGAGATMVALNKENGNPLWRAGVPGNPQAGYATAIVAEIAGTRQYINFCHGGLFGVDARSGQPLWGDNNASNNTANCSSALLIGTNAIFYASGYGTGGALLQFAGRQARPTLTYKTEKMKNHHGGMVELDGFIYGANENILTCLNAQTGMVGWQDRVNGQGKGAITYADGHLYFRSENGPMFLIEATPRQFTLKGQFDQPERSNRQAWARPVVAAGKLFLRDQDLLLCYDLKN